MKMLLKLCLLGLATGAYAAGELVDTAVRHHIQAPDHASRTDSVWYFEDFENGWNGWSGVDLTAMDPVWHTSDFNAWDGDSWWSGMEELNGYDNHWLQYLETPEIDLGAAANPELSFQLRYATEAPGGEPAGYDAWDACNVWIMVSDGPWEVLEGFSRPYDAASCYSFGYEFGMGTGIPGWVDDSGGWDWVTRDMSEYAGSTITLRFAFCSDPAYCTIDDPDVWGMIVDDILIDDNGDTYLENDADGTAFPDDLEPVSGGDVAGQFWEITDENAHSPSNSAHVSVSDNLMNALVSPEYEIPEGMDTWFEFWIYNDMQDADGDGDNSLEDYYHVEVSTDGGLVWQNVFYDYGDVSRPGWQTWEDYVPGLPYNGNMTLSLNEYAGESVRLRWRITTDGNDDGGVGDGMYIDDVEIWASDVPANDVACTQIIPEYPRTEGVDCETYVEYANMGSEYRSQVQAWMVANEVLDGPILPRMDIPPLSSENRIYEWTPEVVGENELKSYANNPDDQNNANDTLWVSPIDVLPAGEYRLGYSFVDAVYYFSGGDPAMFVEWPDGVSQEDGLLVTYVLVGLYDPDGTGHGGNDIRLHLMEDDGGVPGTEIWSQDYTLGAGDAMVLWNFEVNDETAVAYDDFWVWAERLDDYPHPLGADLVYQPFHYAVTDGIDFDLDFSDEDGNELMMWIDAEQYLDVAERRSGPAAFVLEPAYPNPFNPRTSIRFSAPAGERVSLKVYNLAGQEVATLFEGPGTGSHSTVVFDASGLASGVYFARLQGEGDVARTQKMVLVK